MSNKINEIEKKYIDLDYIFLRDKIIKILCDSDIYFTLYDSKRIRQLLKLLLKYLEKGNN